MPCTVSVEVLHAFLGGQLPPVVAEGVRVHLDDECCPDCNRRLGELAADLSELHHLLDAGAGGGVSSAGATPGQSVAEGDRAAEAPLRPEAAAEGRSGPAPMSAVVGRYQVLGELGRGGMGVVYLAFHPGLQRRVALKVILTAEHASPRERERFWIEARAAARLEHENVVRIYELGEDLGRPYLAMEYVAGGTLAAKSRGQPQLPREAAEMMERLARAVAAAHAHKIIHRDLKPENVLLTENGVPKIADFGLAKTEGATGLTASGSVLGTPGYMAPEQAEGKHDVVGPGADIWALGAILYELLTGQPPFRGTTAMETLQFTMTEEPVTVRRLNKRVPRDLEIISLKCLEKDPRKRYASAAKLAEDLRRFLDGVPIQARAVRRLERAWRWCRRRPLTAGLLAAIVVLLGTVTTFSLWVAAKERDRAQEAAWSLSIRKLQSELFRSAHPGWRRTALSQASEAARLKKSPLLRDLAAAALSGLDVTRESQDDKGASAVAFHVAGDQVLVSGANDSTNKPSRPARLWRLAPNEVIAEGQLGAGAVGFATDGTPLQLVKEDASTLRLWDLQRRRDVQRYRLAASGVWEWWEPPYRDGALTALAPGGTLLAAAAVRMGDKKEEHIVAVWKSSESAPVWQQELAATALTFSDGSSGRGTLLAMGGPTGDVTLFAMPEGRQLGVLRGASHAVIRCLAFDRSGKRLAVGDGGGVAAVWDLGSEPPRHLMGCPGNDYGVDGVVFSPDGQMLVSIGHGHVRLWDAATGRLVLEGIEVGRGEAGAAFSPNGRRLAVVGSERFQLWGLEDGRGISTLRGLASRVERVCFSADGKSLAALAHDWRVAVWDLETGLLRNVLDLPGGLYVDNAGVVLSADGRFLGFANEAAACLFDVDSGVRIGYWDLRPGMNNVVGMPAPGRLSLLRNELRSGKGLPLSASNWAVDPRICRLYDLVPKQRLPIPVKEIKHFNRAVYCTSATPTGSCFLIEGLKDGPDGRQRGMLALNGNSGDVLWGPTTLDYDQPASSVTTSSSGDIAMVCPSGGTLKVVWVASGEEVTRATGETRSTWEALEVRGGAANALFGENGLGLYVREATEPLVVLTITSRQGSAAAFSHQGDRLAWGNADGPVHVADLKKVRDELRARDLTWGWPDP